MPEYWRKEEKLAFLKDKKNLFVIDWTDLQPDHRHSWLNEGIDDDFSTFIPIGTKDKPASILVEPKTILAKIMPGVNTSRDSIVYDFDSQALIRKVEEAIEVYNAEVFRWIKAGKPKDVDRFVSYEKVKWSEHLKQNLKREHYGQLDSGRLRLGLYRPFCKKWLYFDSLLNDRPSQFNNVFPNQLNIVRMWR